jgi:hypothetical protein
MSRAIQETFPAHFLRCVPFEQGFHFNTGRGTYSGITATSLPDFDLKLRTVDINTIMFHYPRGDFQKWIENIVGDKTLADQLRAEKTIGSGENLRGQLVDIIQTRIKALSRATVGT